MRAVFVIILMVIATFVGLAKYATRYDPQTWFDNQIHDIAVQDASAAILGWDVLQEGRPRKFIDLHLSDEDSYTCIAASQMMVINTYIGAALQNRMMAEDEDKVSDAEIEGYKEVERLIANTVAGHVKSLKQLVTIRTEVANAEWSRYEEMFKEAMEIHTGQRDANTIDTFKMGLKCKQPKTDKEITKVAKLNNFVHYLGDAKPEVEQVKEVDLNAEYRDNLDPRDSSSEPTSDAQPVTQLRVAEIQSQPVTEGEEIVEGDSGEEIVEGDSASLEETVNISVEDIYKAEEELAHTLAVEYGMSDDEFTSVLNTHINNAVDSQMKYAAKVVGAYIQNGGTVSKAVRVYNAELVAGVKNNYSMYYFKDRLTDEYQALFFKLTENSMTVTEFEHFALGNSLEPRLASIVIHQSMMHASMVFGYSQVVNGQSSKELEQILGLSNYWGYTEEGILAGCSYRGCSL